MIKIEQLKQLIERETGLRFNRSNKICCPFHDEKTPSFSLYERNGKEKYKCFSCERQGDIIDFIREFHSIDYFASVEYLNENGFKVSNTSIVPKIYGTMKGKDYKLNEIYDFKNHLGITKYYKIKFLTDKGKECRYCHEVDGKLKWERNGEELPYNLYGLIKSKSNTVFIVEGEKDAETLNRHKLTTISLKGFKFDEFHCKFFKNKNIIIVPDNDQAGRDYKERTIKGLLPYIRSYKVFPIEKYAKDEKQDITDLLHDKYITIDEFKAVFEDIKPVYTYLDDKGKLIPVKLAKQILNCEHIIYSESEGFFHYEDGYYKHKESDKDVMMKKVIAAYLDDRLNTNINKTEVLNHIKELSIREEIGEDKQYLNFKNGLLKVTKESYELLDHTPDIITTHRFNYDFEKVSYKKSNYYNGLKYALYDNKDLVDFLQQFAGACLMPNARLMKAALIISGAKGTGKSTFIEPLQEMVEGLYKSVEMKTLQENEYILNDFIGKKCLLSTEDDSKTLESCNRLKALIFGERLSTNRKFKGTVELKLNLSIIIALNNIPIFKDSSNSMFDRLHFVNFKRKIRGTSKEDPHYIEKIIKNEMPHVISFALDGLMKLLKNDYRIVIPEEIKALKSEVIANNSPLESWLYSCTIQGMDDGIEVLNELYTSYLGYCVNELSLDYWEAKRDLGKIKFASILKDRFQFKEQLKAGGVRYSKAFIGIKLNNLGKDSYVKSKYHNLNIS